MIGDSRNGNGYNTNKTPDFTCYSRVKGRGLDNKNLEYQFRNGMILLRIVDQNDKSGKALEEGYITPSKAVILKNMIGQLEKDIEDGSSSANSGYGIVSGSNELVTAIIIHTNDDGKIMITLAKVNNEGKYTNKVDFVFDEDFNKGFMWTDIEANTFVQKTVPTADWNTFKNTIFDFADHGTGALAYIGIDLNKYNYSRLLNKFDPIYAKLGIEKPRSGDFRQQQNNYYNNAGNNAPANSDHKSSDDVLGSIEDLE